VFLLLLGIGTAWIVVPEANQSPKLLAKGASSRARNDLWFHSRAYGARVADMVSLVAPSQWHWRIHCAHARWHAC